MLENGHHEAARLRRTRHPSGGLRLRHQHGRRRRRSPRVGGQRRRQRGDDGQLGKRWVGNGRHHGSGRRRCRRRRGNGGSRSRRDDGNRGHGCWRPGWHRRSRWRPDVRPGSSLLALHGRCLLRDHLLRGGRVVRHGRHDANLPLRKRRRVHRRQQDLRVGWSRADRRRHLRPHLLRRRHALSVVTDAARATAQPGGQASGRPASTCRWTWNTDWPASGPAFMTTRNPPAA